MHPLGPALLTAAVGVALTITLGLGLWNLDTSASSRLVVGLGATALFVLLVEVSRRMGARSPDDSDQAYHNFFARNPQPMWVYDLRTRHFLEVNDAAVEHYGYSREEFLGMTIEDLLPSEDARGDLDAWVEPAEGSDQVGTQSHRLRDGRVIRVQVTSQSMEFQGRHSELVLAVDVTDRRSAEEMLRAHTEGYRRQYEALANLMQGRFLMTPDEETAFRTITETGAAALQVARASIWRYSPTRDAIVTADLFDTRHGRSGSTLTLERATYPGYFAALESNQVIPAEDAREDPRTREFTENYLAPLGISSMLDAPILLEGRLEGVLCLEHVGPPRSWSHADQTFAVSLANLVAMILLEQARLRNEERFRLLASVTSDAIWDWDIANDTLWWSDGLESLFGYQPDDLKAGVGHWESLVHPDDRDKVRSELDQVLNDPEAERWSGEYRFRRTDGRYAHVLDRGRVIRNGSHRAIRMIGGITDLSERHEVEMRFFQREKLDSVGRLAGGVAHDFNNLLTVILSCAELIIGRGEPDQELRSDIEEIQDAAVRAAELTGQLLAFSRRQLLQPQVLDLNMIVEQALPILRRLVGVNCDIRCEMSSELDRVRADPGRLHQVLVNLVLNASDAMPGGGTIRIETANVSLDPEPDPGRTAGHPTPHILLRVSDEGIGMDPETFEHLFEPFFSTKPAGEGTGLGLSTVYGIVKQSGGSVSAESNPGKGSRFSVYLPSFHSKVDPTTSPIDSLGGEPPIHR